MDRNDTRTIVVNTAPHAGFAVLGDTSPPAWETDVDQVHFRGSIALSEVEFFHRRSRTLIMADFVQNFQLVPGRPLRNAFLRWSGILQGGAPRDLRLSFMGRRRRRIGQESLRHILSWDFGKVVVAHGDCVESDARSFIERSFRWLQRA